jgi:hypothetical protein
VENKYYCGWKLEIGQIVVKLNIQLHGEVFKRTILLVVIVLLMHTIGGRNQMGYDFVEVLMQIFVVGGNQVGCFVGAFMY